MGRHAGAVFAAASVSSATQAAVGTLAALAATRMTDGSLGSHTVIAVAVTTLALWITLFMVVFAELAVGFTVARAALTLSRQNFGAAYLVTGLVIGIIEASVISALKGAPSPRDFVFAAVTGTLGGFVYWLVASRDRDVMSDEERARIATAFS